jgi:hypothetical protein
MSQMIGREVIFIATVIEHPFRKRHDAGTIDQNVEVPSRGEETVCKGVNRFRVDQIHSFDLDPLDSSQCMPSFIQVAGRHNHSGSG